MSTINFKLEEQVLIKTTDAVISAGDVETDVCVFEFDETWDGYIKTAVFYQDKGNEQYSILDKNNTCVIPAEAMKKKGVMCVGVFGVKGKTLLTSTVERVEIEEGATDSDIDLEPSDDIFMAIVARYQAILDEIQESNDTYAAILEAIQEQNKILEGLDAFDVQDIQTRLSEIEMEINEVEALGEDFKKNFRINNVTVAFDENGQFTYEDERINSQTLVDVFFSKLCLASAAAAIVTVQSCDGYILFETTYKCNDILTCDLYCMGV